MLKVERLCKSYKSKLSIYNVLKDISFTINRGEFVSIMGPSGSGKTTLLNAISGFIPVDSGNILLDGTSLLTSDEDEVSEIRQSKLGFVFQDFMLMEGLTVYENILLPQIIKNEDDISTSKVENLMNVFNITSLRDKYTNELSGGQKQRIAVARALINEPLLVLADEPTGNLDSKSSVDVINTFIDAKNKLNATILMVTHDAFAASYSDRIIALKDGQVVSTLVKNKSNKEFLNDILSLTKDLNGESYDY